MGNLYEHIEQLAGRKGYQNMTELCAAAKVSRAAMSELKMGRSKELSMLNAQRLADTLGVSLDAVYGRAQPEDRRITDEDIKFALFGGDGEITEAMYQEVRQFAAYVKQREQKKG